MAKILIVPENIEFDTTDDRTILEVGLTKNLNLPHACKKGNCGACKCKVFDGIENIFLSNYNNSVLTDEELSQGYTLLCRAYAKDSVILNIANLKDSLPIKIYPAKVLSLEKNSNVAILRIKVSIFQKFIFYAGQYIDVILDGKNRSYSIANACKEDGIIEIHIKYHLNGVFSEYVWNKIESGKTLLRFRGPLGNFKLQEKSDCRLLFVCTGTGFAPIKAMIESLLLQNSKREIYLYWGNRFTIDFYDLNIIEQWKKQLNLKLVLCVSQEEVEDNKYKHGRITDYIVIDFDNLHDYEVYACGNLQMIQDIYTLGTQKKGLLKQRFFSDAFIPSV